MSGFLSGKTFVVMGVANKKSIAWGAVQSILAQDGKVILTYQNERLLKSLKRFVPEDIPMIECDVAEDENIEKAFSEIKDEYGKVDGIMHAIAFADRDTLTQGLIHTTKEGYNLAQDISAYSFIAAARYAREILNEHGSLVTMTFFGSTRAIPNYNMMGVAKAALESNVRYLASELGQEGIRVNAISAGAVKTLAITGIKQHSTLLKASEERTIDNKGVTTEQIGNVAAFLLSDLASGVTGDIIYVDKGVHLV